VSAGLLIVAVLGFALGFATGRWWALLTGVVFAIWIGLGTQADEVSARELILRYGAVAAVTVAAGVIVRKRGVY
jgi:hypothetical protein